MGEWLGRSVFALAVGVAIGWAGALLLLASPWGGDLTEAGSHVLAGIGGGMVAILGANLGRHDRP